MTATGASTTVGLNIVSYYLGRKDPSKSWRIVSKVLVPAVVVGINAYAGHYKYSTGLDNPFPTTLARF
jgi:Na+-driven multidrug efflux pump